MGFTPRAIDHGPRAALMQRLSGNIQSRRELYDTTPRKNIDLRVPTPADSCSTSRFEATTFLFTCVELYDQC